MKTLIKSAIIAGISILAAGEAYAQSTATHNATPTTLVSGTTFSFSMFDSGLGNLTAVQLLFNSSSVTGNVTLVGQGEDYDFNSATAFVRTSGTGLSNQNTSSVGLSFSPSLPDSQIGSFATQVYTLTGSQSLISSLLTYNINSAFLSSYQNAGGSGNTPNFTTRLYPSTSITGATPKPSETFNMAAASSYTLRYTYTPSTAPVPEPGQVAASLLLLGGIGGYVFIKRRRKSATAAA